MTDLKSLFDNLIRTEIWLWNVVDNALRDECDLQLTWFEILRFLARDGSGRVQDIAAEFGITVGGTSKVVDRIEAAGYCARRANPNDRRSSLVELTPTGHDVLDRAMAVFERELQHRIGTVLDGQTIAAVTAALAALHTAHQAPADRQ
ncbi:MarR family winged helix-turn-helix transcriptional regulator [Hoyosella altamirensis]|uniref:DNA-binding MarR family transcriptional regulator n=1 Tax=Hoyosella altamirensis TaxID=616997 RepID=A0A839RK72_9ACTN|nr:MarR family transcriptional regulator [Hoyosella altamirensis]MBB3037055.1 DNA-binding MarR family transcriptional regulator [Hoyosella altamirensis]